MRLHAKRLAVALATSAAVLVATLDSPVGLTQETSEPPAQATPSSSPAPPSPTPYSRRGADTCIGCHDEPRILAIFRTRHGTRADPQSPFGHGNLQCEACHGPGAAHSGRVRSGQERPPIPYFGQTASATASEQNEACLGCHRRDMKHGWLGGAHERANLSCASCHSSHEPRDAVLVRAAQAQVCVDCHRVQQLEARMPSSHPIENGRTTCSDCHDPHGTTTDANLVRSTLNATCTSCHAEKRGPFLWEHAPATEDCALCHRPHGSTQPALLKQRAPLLCQQCHSQAGHPSLPPGPSALPGSSPSNYLLGASCLNCHSQVHGSNHPSGRRLMR